MPPVDSSATTARSQPATVAPRCNPSTPSNATPASPPALEDPSPAHDNAAGAAPDSSAAGTRTRNHFRRGLGEYQLRNRPPTALLLRRS
eukprot:3108383-Pleurochrysis_carterae.AAC.1